MFKHILEFLGLRRRRRDPLLSARTFVPAAHPLRPVFDAKYLELRDAMATRDTAAIARLLTADFISIDANAKETSADDMIAAVVALDIDRSKRTARTMIVAIEESDGEAFVEQQYTMTPAPDAPPSMPRSLLSLSRDVWRNVNGTWLLARTYTQEIEVLTSAGWRTYLRKSELSTTQLSGPDSTR